MQKFAYRFRWLALICAALCVVGCANDAESESTRSSRAGSKKKKKKKRGKSSKKRRGAATASAQANDDGSIPRPRPGEVPQLIVGAWSKYKMKSGVITWSLLQKRNTEYLVDVDVQTRVKLAIQAWVNVPDPGDASGTEIRELKYRIGGGAMTVLKGAALGAHAKTYNQLIKGFVPPKFEGLPQEDITVAAGTFRGCYRHTSKETFMGMTSESTIWSHPAVPAPSMVKSQTKDGQTYELIAYGMSGAKKSL